MKFRQTAFFHELVAVVTGSVLAVATVAFLTLPHSIAASAVMQHLT
ncbi:MAG TPA: hypothetical protein PK620_12490 [Denitromonas sp.]|nr:hypothetical protein [Rhodocyclaceae bacterium]MCP5221373.1 hypothetical protein [Zoogloeaceae bacterium]HPR06514.1 hypothetical protein [Denitromonas sp.]HQU89145.1 hypothetical protein [Denitromonas sp.]HQV15728.1 hypothetical protein [Denitromonas sp.]